MKMYNKKSLISVFLLSILLMGVSCKKQLDVNQNPNVPTLSQGNVDLVFPAAVLATVGKVGGDLTILGGLWSQVFTQAALANQYRYLDSYDVKSTDFNASWDVLYSSGLKNYKYVIDQAKTSQNWSYYLMGNVMNAYTTEILVDLYDQIPYFEALQGTATLQPKFDDGFTIYKDLIARIDTALTKDFTVSTNAVTSTADLVFGGNVNKWIAFANTLKLKMYLRMVNAQPALAQSGITSMINSGAVFLTVDASVTNFADILDKDNPFFEQNRRSLNTPDNLRASTTMVSWLVANGDPRAIAYYGSATPLSENQGDFAGAGYGSVPDFVQSPTDPVIFISAAESYLLQAEADARYMGGAKAQGLYNKGVLAAFTATFTATGNNGASLLAGVYAYPAAGTLEQQIEAIVTQKWASFAHGCHMLEGFFDKNRTGYPRTSAVYSNSSSYVPGQLVVSKNSVLGAGLMPKRLVFPFDETSLNSNAPALVPITTAVWWGK